MGEVKGMAGATEDYYPSIPGKPETFSPEYWKFHAMLSKTGPLSAGEAEEVYGRIHELVRQAVPEGGLLQCLYRDLIKEAVTGKRCSVCLNVDDPNCTYGC